MPGKASAFKTPWVIVWTAIRSVLRRPGAVLALSVIPVILINTWAPYWHFHLPLLLPSDWLHGSLPPGESTGSVHVTFLGYAVYSLNDGLREAAFFIPAIWGWLQLMDGKRLYDCFPQTMFRSMRGLRIAVYLVGLFSLQRLLGSVPLPFFEALLTACHDSVGVLPDRGFPVSLVSACLALQIYQFISFALLSAILLGFWIAVVDSYQRNIWASLALGWRRSLRFPFATLLIGVMIAGVTYFNQYLFGLVGSATFSILRLLPWDVGAGSWAILVSSLGLVVTKLIWVGVALGAWHIYAAETENSEAP